MKQKQGQLLVLVTAGTTYRDAGSTFHKSNVPILDVMTLLKALQDPGKQIRIAKATLSMYSYCESHHFVELCAMVSDSAIAAAEPTDNTLSMIIQEEADVMTDGEYEISRIGKLQIKEHSFPDSTYHYQNVGTFDLTAFCQKLTQNARNPATTGVNAAIVALSICQGADKVIHFGYLLEMWYSEHAAPLRLVP